MHATSMKSSHVRYGVALANSILFSLSVPVASFPWGLAGPKNVLWGPWSQNSTVL